MADKVDSNATGLRYAEEASLKMLPVTPTWYQLEPNEYDDFGGEITTVARRPINPSRQLRKGTVTDLEASGGFTQDLTHSNLIRLLQGFFFADIREQLTTRPMNGTAIPITLVSAATDGYQVAAGMPAFISGDILFASGFAIEANNGMKRVSADVAAGTTVNVLESLVDEAAPPAGATLRRVGHGLPGGNASFDVVGGKPRLVRSTGFNFTSLALVPGQWIYLGGDLAANAFDDNTGFARVSVINVAYLEFDKTSWEPVIEAGTGKSISFFVGGTLKNEKDPALIKRRTYNLERTLGADADGTMSEYLVGAVPNEMTLNIPEADKVTVDLSFIALDNEQRTGLEGLKAGTRPTQALEEPFNTTYDVTRTKMTIIDVTNSNPTPLFGYASEITLTINNNVSPNKAIGVLGGFDTTAGLFEIGGESSVYFSSIPALQAIRNNADVDWDVWLQHDNQALMFDIGLLTLGDGRLEVELDEPIMAPLTNEGAENKFGHTLLMGIFYYLPDAAGGG